MMTRSVRTHATPDELLALLVDVEHDLWNRGGVHRLRDRRDIVAAALAAGCGLNALADALGVNPSEVSAWGTG
jgi:hypothetical protein